VAGTNPLLAFYMTRITQKTKKLKEDTYIYTDGLLRSKERKTQQGYPISLKHYGEYTDRRTDTDRQQGDLISLLLFLLTHFPYFEQN
jgi:hypothetical protein